MWLFLENLLTPFCVMATLLSGVYNVQQLLHSAVSKAETIIRQAAISGVCYHPLSIPYHRLTDRDDKEMSVWMSGMGDGGGSGGDGR